MNKLAAIIGILSLSLTTQAALQCSDALLAPSLNSVDSSFVSKQQSLAPANGALEWKAAGTTANEVSAQLSTDLSASVQKMIDEQEHNLRQYGAEIKPNRAIYETAKMSEDLGRTLSVHEYHLQEVLSKHPDLDLKSVNFSAYLGHLVYGVKIQYEKSGKIMPPKSILNGRVYQIEAGQVPGSTGVLVKAIPFAGVITSIKAVESKGKVNIQVTVINNQGQSLTLDSFDDNYNGDIYSMKLVNEHW